VIKPEEEHTRRQRQRPFLGVRFVFALRVPVNVGDRAQARVALVVHETQVFLEPETAPCPSACGSAKKNRLTRSR
jgi:hypothetical protein